MSKDKICALNDAFRKSIVTPAPLGKVYMTDGVATHGEPFRRKALEAIQMFDGFTEDFDPHGEHDMMRVIVDGIVVWGKIDCYDKRDPDLGAEDPSDPTTTERLLTLMLPEEW